MRDPGYYFVKVTDSDEWSIGHYSDGSWWTIGDNHLYYDELFDVIGDRIIMPE